MKKNICLLATLFLFCGQIAFAQERPEIGPYVEAYSGPKLEEVWMLRIGARAANEVIIQIAGVDHEWNHSISKCSVKKDGATTSYVVLVNDKPHTLLVKKSHTGLELHLPNEKEVIPLTYNKELSLEGNREAFLTDYLRAQKVEK
ncbi:MAG: hypothetical protein LBS40_08540 [Burkholderiales bacterium]|nr:hypothetical protein [Burkholderiales bacterium]